MINNHLLPPLEKKLQTYFWLIVFLHLFLWSFLPLFIRHSISNDLIEALTWGQNLQWGYDKNPFLPALIANWGGKIGPNGFGIYFIQQLFIILGVYSVRTLTFELTRNPVYAYIASVALLINTAYSIEVQIYNDNYILQGLIPLSALFFYRATKKNKLRQWFFCATSLALATLAKYSAIIFLPLFAFYFVRSSHLKKNYFSYKPYLALLFYIALLIPNLVWLNQQNFNALNYAFITRGLLNHLNHLQYLINNITFLASIVITIFPTLIAFLLAIEGKINKRSLFLFKTNITSNIYLYSSFLCFGPISLLFILGTLIGFSLHREWANTFISFVGMLFVIFLQPKISLHSLKRFTLFILVIMLSLAVGYIIVCLKNNVGTYPGMEIARFATQLWHSQYGTKLSYVGGDRYTAGYIGYYSPDKPIVWMEWNTKIQPWINKKNLRCKGALFLIESGHTIQHFFKGAEFPNFLHKQFPNLIELPQKTFTTHYKQTKGSTIKVHFGLVPPNNSYCHHS